MTQHQAIQFLLPILIILPVLYFRMRKMARAQPLKLDRLWIRPALFLVITALVLLAPPPHNHPERVLVALDFAWLALAGLLGAVAGWQWGRTMAIDVHPEDGTLMVRGGQAAVAVLVVLILFRLGLRAGLSVEAEAWHINMLLVSDASIVFTAMLFTLRSVEMYFRARRVMALKGAA
ncbi:MAG TPA: CcdC protein domain-containing protein [Rhizomicrobium sp.]|jgi:hypothetical protein|nr:CcdC protein domain-containing protein [Rhizomicrobium sp.]